MMHRSEKKIWPCFSWLAAIFSKLPQILICIASLSISIFVFLNFSAFILSDEFLQNLTGAEVILTSSAHKISLTVEEKKALLLLVEKGHALTQDQFLEVLSQFYNSIINALIVVISLLGVSAYFSISSISRKNAEDLAEKCAEREIRTRLSDDEYVRNLFSKDNQLSELINEGQARNNTVSEMVEKSKRFDDRLHALEVWLMSSSSGDSKGGDVKIKRETKNGNN